MPHATRPAAHDPVGGRRQVEAVQQFGDPAIESLCPYAEKPPLKFEVVTAGGHRVQRGTLGDDTDLAPHPAGVPQHVVAGDRGLPRVRPGQRGQDLDGGGLAGPVRPEQAENLAGPDVEAEPVEGLDPTRVILVGVGLAQLDCRHGSTHGDRS
jgi:hypothetical protein